MQLLALAGVPGIVEKLSEPALGVIAQTTLGAVALLSLAVAILSVWKLSSVQDKRAADAKDASNRIEAMITKILDFQTDSNRTIDALVSAEKSAETVSREQTLLLAQLKQTFDTTIRDVLIHSRGQPPPPTPPQPGKPYLPPRRQ